MQTVVSSGVSVNLGAYNLDLKYSETVPCLRPKIVPKDYSLALIGYLPGSLVPSSALSGVGLSLLVDKAGPVVRLVNALYGSQYDVRDEAILTVDGVGNMTPLAVGETDISLISGLGVSGQDDSRRANLNVRVTDFVYPVKADAGGGWGRDLVLTPFRNFTSGVGVAADAHFTTNIYTNPDLYFRLTPTQGGIAVLTVTDGSIVSRTYAHELYFYTLDGKYNTTMSVGDVQSVTVDGLTDGQALSLNWQLIGATDESLVSNASLNVSMGKTVIVTASQAGQFRIRAYMDADRFYISNVITIT